MADPRPVYTKRSRSQRPRHNAPPGTELDNQTTGTQFDVVPVLDTTMKVQISDQFDNLSNWQWVTGDPRAEGGRLVVNWFSTIRHKLPMMTDFVEIEAQVVFRLFGKTRILFGSDDRFTNYYGIEIESGLFRNYMHIIRGRSLTDVLKTPFGQMVNPTDTVKIRYESPGLLRMYRNGNEIGSKAMPPTTLRRWAVVTGIDGPLSQGVQLTSITAKDI